MDDDHFADFDATYDDLVYDDYVLTEAEATLSAWLPKPFCLLSMMGSYIMLRELVTDHFTVPQRQTRGSQSRNEGSPIGRMLMSMAVADLSASTAIFLGTWPAPKDITNVVMVGNVGTQGTCTFQGFMEQLGYVGSVLGTTSLTILYLYVVRYNKRDQDLVMLEWLLHGATWGVALGCAIYPIPLELYNPSNDACFLGSNPPSCNHEDIPCVRGPNPELHHVVFALLPFVFLFLVILPIMIYLTFHVRKMENTIRRYSQSAITNATASTIVETRSSMLIVGESTTANTTSTTSGRTNRNSSMRSNRNSSMRSNRSSSRRRSSTSVGANMNVDRRKSKAVAMQGILYSGAFILTYVLMLATIISELMGQPSDLLFLFGLSIMANLAGFFNMLIFIRLRRTMKTPEGRFIRSIFCCTNQFCCGCYSLQACRHQQSSPKQPSSNEDQAPGQGEDHNKSEPNSKQDKDVSPSCVQVEDIIEEEEDVVPFDVEENVEDDTLSSGVEKTLKDGEDKR